MLRALLVTAAVCLVATRGDAQHEMPKPLVTGLKNPAAMKSSPQKGRSRFLSLKTSAPTRS